MVTVSTRQLQLVPLTHEQVDQNFINLRDAVDANTANVEQFGEDGGSALIGNGGESVKASLDALQLADYDALRAYVGPRTSVYVTGYLITKAPSGISGMFVRDASDTTSLDNGGTIIRGSHCFKRQFSGPVNAQWFGADSTGNVDSLSSIQEAINSIPAYGGAVYLPRGVYLTTDSIVLPSGRRIKLFGDGNCSVNNGYSATTIKKAASVTNPAIVIQTDASSVESLTVQGVAGNQGDGIVVKASRVTVRDVSVFACGNDGIRVGTDAGGENCNLWYMENIKCKGNGRHGVCLSQGNTNYANANGGTLVHPDLQSNAAAGLYVGSAQINNFVGGAYQNNGTYGIHLSANANYNAFFGGDVEANGTNQFRIESGSIGNAIFNYTMLYSNFSIATTTDNNRIECIDHNRVVSGIKFPPTQVPSSDPNTIDDYREVNFTPVVSGSATVGAAASYSAQSGKITKIGRSVTFSLHVAYSGHTGTGNTEITGIPYISGLSSDSFELVRIMQNGGPAPGAGNVRLAFIQGGTQKIVLREQSQTTALIGNSNAITSSGEFWINGTYTAAN